MFRLAHLSDVHLAPLPWGRFGDYLNKRAIGLMSWYLRRRKVHRPEVLAQIVDSIRSARPDHIAVTGDLANISLPAEFCRAQGWLKALGDAATVSFVPGNHDAYVHVEPQAGIDLWRPYMSGDLNLLPGEDAGFPYVRQRRNVALIGVSTAEPQALHKAGGSVGEGQLDRLRRLLQILRERGFCRVVMIHHPPLPGQAIARKALSDAGELKELLVAEGADLVLHGHNHVHMHETLDTKFGPTHIVGVPSASAAAGGHKPPAAWYLHTIRRQEQRWQIEVTVHNYDGASDTIVPETPFKLS